MEVFRSETDEIIRRFLNRRLTFPKCIAALDDALADLLSRPNDEQSESVRGLVLANNEIVMKEMERRGKAATL